MKDPGTDGVEAMNEGNGTSTFDELADFIDNRMRMQHVYQPVMLMALLRHGGSCPEETIARDLLSQDVSQVEYYEHITQNMVGDVLRNHGISTRDRKSKTHSLVGFGSLDPDEVSVLTEKCQEKLDKFMDDRGDQPWRHRMKSPGYITGPLQYEIVKAAKGRCELCGIPKEEKHLQVDHIVPRARGGSDDLSNLQALCYTCNAQKRDRDDTDFREVGASYELRDDNCSFCSFPTNRFVLENELAVAVDDSFPVTARHMLVIVKRHVGSLFELGRPEINACMLLLNEARSLVLKADPSVSDFNVGVNDGPDAGQTIPHCHWHLIPRRSGDVAEPRGGIRNTIPGKGAY